MPRHLNDVREQKIQETEPNRSIQRATSEIHVKESIQHRSPDVQKHTIRELQSASRCEIDRGAKGFHHRPGVDRSCACKLNGCLIRTRCADEDRVRPRRLWESVPEE